MYLHLPCGTQVYLSIGVGPSPCVQIFPTDRQWYIVDSAYLKECRQYLKAGIDANSIASCWWSLADAAVSEKGTETAEDTFWSPQPTSRDLDTERGAGIGEGGGRHASSRRRERRGGDTRARRGGGGEEGASSSDEDASSGAGSLLQGRGARGSSRTPPREGRIRRGSRRGTSSDDSSSRDTALSDGNGRGRWRSP